MSTLLIKQIIVVVINHYRNIGDFHGERVFRVIEKIVAFDHIRILVVNYGAADREYAVGHKIITHDIKSILLLIQCDQPPPRNAEETGNICYHILSKNTAKGYSPLCIMLFPCCAREKKIPVDNGAPGCRFLKQCALSSGGRNCFGANFVKENALTKTKLRACKWLQEAAPSP